MPATSAKQKKFMDAAANNPAFAKKAGVPVKVAKEYSQASKGQTFKQGGEMKQAMKKTTKKTQKFGTGGLPVGSPEMGGGFSSATRPMLSSPKTVIPRTTPTRPSGPRPATPMPSAPTPVTSPRTTINPNSSPYTKDPFRPLPRPMPSTPKSVIPRPSRPMPSAPTPARRMPASPMGGGPTAPVNLDKLSQVKSMVTGRPLNTPAATGSMPMKKGGRIASKGEHAVQKQSKRGTEMVKMARGGGIEIRGKTKGKMLARGGKTC